jgi:hypothetical protein
MNIKEKQVWIGLAKVKPTKENDIFDPSSEAFVNALSYTDNAEHFTAEIKAALSQLHFELLETEDVTRLSDRIKNYEVDANLLILADEVKEIKEVRFGNFHTYQVTD